MRLEKVIEKNDKNVGAHVLLGMVLNSEGKIDAANKEYRKVLTLSPKHPLAANNLAANLADGGGNLDEALKFAQIAREAVPEDPSVETRSAGSITRRVDRYRLPPDRRRGGKGEDQRLHPLPPRDGACEEGEEQGGGRRESRAVPGPEVPRRRRGEENPRFPEVKPLNRDVPANSR